MELIWWIAILIIIGLMFLILYFIFAGGFGKGDIPGYSEAEDTVKKIYLPGLSACPPDEEEDD